MCGSRTTCTRGSFTCVHGPRIFFFLDGVLTQPRARCNCIALRWFFVSVVLLLLFLFLLFSKGLHNKPHDYKGYRDDDDDESKRRGRRIYY